MASLREIRKRVRSILSTQKITGAMKLVAASKLRRAQNAILSVRPYANELGAMLQRLATRADSHGSEAAHPLLEMREPRRVLLAVMTSDRGLCGAFNINILRQAEHFIREHGSRFEKLTIATIGRKGRDYFTKRKVATLRNYPNVFNELGYHKATNIAEGLCQDFIAHDLDAVYLLYNEFKSAMTQRVVVTDLLPIVHAELPIGEDIDYIYEPNHSAVLNLLVPRYVATIIWRALLESSAAEHGARMTAMDTATQNAKDLVSRLTLLYNRTRQAAITRELMEIVNGAEALKG
ncbi:MAG: ATP synthase F1 subunit gamma [Deltaproteobacteria bacterium]|nr:ATP synthase F1 subunit gamma [Deltaproteobacteria bacterium]